MEHINFLITSMPDSVLQGGKGSNLIKLIKLGTNIPPGYIITTNSFENFIKASKFNDKLTELLSKPFESNEIIEHSAKIIDMIINTQMPESVINEIKRGHILLNEPNSSFAVRSSASIEDTTSYSFAGQANTYLFQKNINDVIKSVKKCWASLYSPQALLYFLQMKKKNDILSLENVRMAIIIQEMINSSVSGVLFTTNILNNNHDEMLINSSWGLGEAIVNNLVNPDMFILQKDEFKIIQKILGKKERKSIPNSVRSGTVIIDTNMQSREKFSLTDDQLRQLHELGLKAEKAFNRPQDIEWAFENGKLYTLQSRPITTK